MSEKFGKILPKAMIELKERIEEWRRNKTGHVAMPQKLWQEAVVFANKYGVCPVARNLNIGHVGLAKMVAGKMPQQRKKRSIDGFVEFAPAKSVLREVSPHYCIELYRQDGCRVVIKNADSSCVSKVAESFFR